MGIAFASLEYLSDRGFLSETRRRLLDIGTQHLFHLTIDGARAFAARHGGIADEPTFRRVAEQLVLRSQPGSIPNRSWLSELIDLTNIEYTSFDVCPGLRTEIFDLNRQELPEKYSGHFDVILNFGTTEHIFNQYNSYRLMHDALSPGGVFFHQVPTSGYVDHGYFCYHPLFFKDLATANGYDVIDMWYVASGAYSINPTIDFRDALKPGVKASANISEDAKMPLSALLNVILRKTTASPFRLALELETSHSALSSQVVALYTADPIVRQIRARDLATELARRVRARIGV